jgi:hypothetical protein
MQRRLPIEPCAVAARNGSSFARSVGIGMWDGRGMAETEDGFVLVWTHAAGLAVPCVTGTCAAPRPVAGPLFSNTRGRGDSVPVAARRDVNLTGRCSADRGTDSPPVGETHVSTCCGEQARPILEPAARW